MTSNILLFFRSHWFAIVPLAFASIQPATAQNVTSPPTIRTAPQQAKAGQLSPTPRQKEIMRIVLAGDGYITKELHGEFWGLMPFSGKDLREVSELMTALRGEVLGPTRKLNYETWRSAEASLRAGRVSKTAGLEAAIRGASIASENAGYRAAISQSMASVDRILQAAANRTPLETSNGPTFLTEDLIAQTIAGIEGGMKRFEMLTTSTWSEAQSVYSYPEVHVSMLSPWPYVPERSEVRTPDGKKANLLSLSRTLSAKQAVYVSFGNVANEGGKITWSDPAGTAIRNVKASLDAVGAQGRPAIGSLWRGRISATGSGAVSSSAGKKFASVRNVHLSEFQGFLTLVAVSDISLLDSQELLDMLESQTQIMQSNPER